MRKAGFDYQTIADRLGYRSPSGAHKAVSTALNKTLREPAKALRQVELERLDALLTGVWSAARRGNLGAVDRVLKIMDRRAKLLGLDAPTKVAIKDWRETLPDGLDADEVQRQFAAILTVAA